MKGDVMESNNCMQTWNPPVNMTTTGVICQNNAGDYWPWGTYPTTAAYPYFYVTQPPLVCSGDVHVFPCPHCDKCKCGAATVKKAKSAK